MAVGKVTFTRADREKLAELLCLLNRTSVLTGVLLLGLGLFLRAEMDRWQDVMSDHSVLLVPRALIAAGLAACCVNFLGGRICLDCGDADKFLRWKRVVAPYVAFGFVFTCCVLLAALLCLGVRGQLDESLQRGLGSTMKRYQDRCDLKAALDRLQIQFHCCGNDGHWDWFQVQWISRRFLDMSSREVVDRLRSNVEGKYLTDAVPFSCCSTFSPRPCIQRQLRNGSAHFNYDRRSRELNLWRRGCRQALLEHYGGVTRAVGLAVLLIWMFELLVLTGVRYLQTAMENVVRLGDPDLESDGWILENSLAETARSNFNIIKSLGKCYQVDNDPNINIPTVGSEQEVPSRPVRDPRMCDQASASWGFVDPEGLRMPDNRPIMAQEHPTWRLV